MMCSGKSAYRPAPRGYFLQSYSFFAFSVRVLIACDTFEPIFLRVYDLPTYLRYVPTPTNPVSADVKEVISTERYKVGRYLATP